MRAVYFGVSLIAIYILSACKSNTLGNSFSSMSSINRAISFAPGPPTIIYKTHTDYTKYVPILMDKDKKQIISYPALTDIYYQGKLSYPTVLIEGYLLDNRGINGNVAFLSYTYEEYSNLPSTPTIAQLQEKILDKFPLLEMWNCGVRYQYNNEIQELNELIKNSFKGCRQEK